MNQKLLGFIRGIGYPVLFLILSYVVSNLGASGLVDTGTATLITGVVAILEHSLASYLGYNIPATA